jgi:hypothetical protein
VFHSEILNDHAALQAEEDTYLPIPKIRKITQAEIEDNYIQIQKEIMAIIESEMERIYDAPDLAHFFGGERGIVHLN